MVFITMLMIGLVALLVFTMPLSVCIVIAVSELSWREIFSKRLIDESIENFKLIWSAKLFAFACFGISLVLAIPIYDAMKKQKMAENGQCICECRACQEAVETLKKVKVIAEMIGMCTNEVDVVCGMCSNDVDAVHIEAK